MHVILLCLPVFVLNVFILENTIIEGLDRNKIQRDKVIFDSRNVIWHIPISTYLALIFAEISCTCIDDIWNCVRFMSMTWRSRI